MKTHFLFLRGSVYYFRRPIPRHLQHIFNRKEVVVSLRTRDHNVALERYVVEYNKVSVQIRVIESGGRISVGTGYTADVLRSGFDLRQINASAIETDPVDNVFSIFAHNGERVSEWPTVLKSQVDALASTIKATLTWVELFSRFKKLDRDHFRQSTINALRTSDILPNRTRLTHSFRFFPILPMFSRSRASMPWNSKIVSLTWWKLAISMPTRPTRN
ncbi:hypothetical protein IHQ71_18760 [Rhizobium sp. TH2]|uniref:DUF6538 domain-containing protein n=1 Tax=Rhizobium sp. TH2 TaxID=2775403 RepID=UPI002158816E|nr:DUF6538 domain-containing protein [Rhizobium sp. TH2]UVC07248.1 hypothetical protein IHQ71_18760 [Rhizobium sp. TH2]